jgi:hypothetical protein
MIINNNLGKVAVKPRGEFDERQTYNYLDIVTSNGSSYLVLQTVTGATPPNENFYQLMALSGDAATVADEFDSTLPYSKGDYCIYNGELFRFNSDKNAGGWDGSIVDQVVVCGELNNRIEKSSFENAGITSETYVPLFGGAFTVTTSIQSGYNNPYAKATVTGRMDKRYKYRVTINNVQYIMPLDVYTDGEAKSSEYVGNISLTDYNLSGYLVPTRNVNFLIISDMDEANGIEVYTSTAGTYSILVEAIHDVYTEIPNVLVYDSYYSPIFIHKNTSTYDGVSIGQNRITSSRGGYAIGANNTVSGNFAVAIGSGCQASGNYSNASGLMTLCSGAYSNSEGYYTNVSGAISHAEGLANEVSSATSHVEGVGNKTGSGFSGLHVGGVNCSPSNETWKRISYTIYKNGVPSSVGQTTISKYAEIIGNGESDNQRSNARTLDYDGNESLAGSLTLGLGTANEVTITAQQLTQLLALLSN